MSAQALTMLGRLMLKVDHLRSVNSVQKKEIDRLTSDYHCALDREDDLRVQNEILQVKVDKSLSPWEVENLRSDLQRFKVLHDQQRIRMEELTRELNAHKFPTLAQIAKQVYDADPCPIRKTNGTWGLRNENFESDRKIDHVKLVRQKSGCGLKDAYDALTALYESEWRAKHGTLGDMIRAKLGEKSF